MKTDQYTPSELCERFPKLNFRPQDIVTLVRLGFLDAYHSKRNVLISLESFNKLIEFRNHVLDNKKQNLS